MFHLKNANTNVRKYSGSDEIHCHIPFQPSNIDFIIISFHVCINDSSQDLISGIFGSSKNSNHIQSYCYDRSRKTLCRDQLTRYTCSGRIEIWKSRAPGTCNNARRNLARKFSVILFWLSCDKMRIACGIDESMTDCIRLRIAIWVFDDHIM
jgi:hypothetical protein